MKYYPSPRWSHEILDCSMPFTFDQYSKCSYKCLYCFAFFRKTIGNANRIYGEDVRPVNVDSFKQIFTNPDSSQFGEYIKRRITMQWGGMADPFDEHERKCGVGLELLRFLRSIDYQCSFSTKSTWFTKDPRYIEVFKGAKNFNIKFSIITLNDDHARSIEIGVDAPSMRLEAIRRAAAWGIGGVTLRLRPFIPGISNQTYLSLIEAAASAGAEAVSTEFLCIEDRSRLARKRWRAISNIVGNDFDLRKYYKTYTPYASGYLRLNRDVKRPYITAMADKCHELGLRFYVSDAHFKEFCDGGSCCGLRDSFNYSRGQFTNALVLAKKQGQVHWQDIASELEYAKSFLWRRAIGYNQSSSEMRAKFGTFTMYDFIHWNWNHVNGANSPYKYFEGALYPIGKDENGDVVYEYQGEA